MEIGNKSISEMMPYLQQISVVYNLNLNKLDDFRLARKILSNLYCNG